MIKSVFIAVLATAGVVAMGACSSSSSSGAGDNGAGATSGGGFDCSTVCTNASNEAAKAGCMNQPTSIDQCTAGCMQAEASSCKAQFESWFSCLQSATFTCGTDGNPHAMDCEGLENAFKACAAGGGSGGAGGSGTGGAGGEAGGAGGEAGGAGGGMTNPNGKACNDLLNGAANMATWDQTLTASDFKDDAAASAYAALQTCACTNKVADPTPGCADSCTMALVPGGGPNFCDGKPALMTCGMCLSTRCSAEIAACMAN